MPSRPLLQCLQVRQMSASSFHKPTSDVLTASSRTSHKCDAGKFIARAEINRRQRHPAATRMNVKDFGEVVPMHKSNSHLRVPPCTSCLRGLGKWSLPNSGIGGRAVLSGVHKPIRHQQQVLIFLAPETGSP